MKKFNAPEIEVVSFESEAVNTISGTPEWGGGEED